MCVGGGGGQNETVNNVAGLKLAKEVLGRGGGVQRETVNNVAGLKLARGGGGGTKGDG